MKTIIIYGYGGFAREVYHATRTNLAYNIADRFLVDDEYTETVPADKLIEWKDIPKDCHILPAVGNPDLRFKMVMKIFLQDLCPPINNGLLLDDYGVDIGFGSIIQPGTIITTNCQIGQYVIINLNCTIGHDIKIGSFTTISPGVNISGNVTIGKFCQIGSNAVIREKISICDRVIIGAGSVVVKDINEPGTYVGNPVKIINE